MANEAKESTKKEAVALRRIWFPRHTFILPNQLEGMLESAELEGWHPIKMSSICLTLAPSEKKRVCYVCEAGKPTAPHQDQGWDYAGKIGNVRLWRREYTGIKPRSFADGIALVKMVRRAIYGICITFIASSMMSVLMVAFSLVLRTMLPPWAFPLLLGVGTAFLLLAILYGRAFQKLCKTVEALEDKLEAVKKAKNPQN